MNLSPLFTFIVHHFMRARVREVMIFNCWDYKAQLDFARYANEKVLWTQMANVGKDFQFPGAYLNGPSPVLGVLVDLNCNRSADILNMASSDELFTHEYDWLLVDNYYQLTNVQQQFVKAMMSIDAQVTYAALDSKASNSTHKSFVTYDIYNNGKFLGGKLNITINKNVTCDQMSCRERYLSSLYTRTKYGNRCNLNDTTFRISLVVTGIPINNTEVKLLEYLGSEVDYHWDPISRLGYNLLLVIQDMLNFKYRYTYRAEWSKTETTGGTLGDIAQGYADLSNTPFLVLLSRRNLVSPILRVSNFRSFFFFRTPRNEGLYGQVFIRPFSPPLWIAFGIIIIVFAFLFWAIFAIESSQMVKLIRFIPSLLSAFLISFGLACAQSAALIPRTIGGRMVFFSLCLVTFIMYNYYTSVVVSSLVGSPVKSNIRTMKHLTDSNLEIGIEKTAYTVSYLRSTTHPVVRRFIRKKLHGRLNENSSLWLGAFEGLEKVRQGGFAYHSESATAYKLIEKYYTQYELCDLNEVPLRSDNGLVATLGKNSTYKEIIRINMIRMEETGITEKHRRFWLKSKVNCFANSVMVIVGLEYTGPLFVSLGIAYGVALLVLILEIVHKKLVSKHY